MKKTLLSFFFIVPLLFSCSSDENDPNQIIDNAQQGAVIRALTTENINISPSQDQGTLNALLEYNDAEDGGLLDKLNIYITFFDKSENAGDSSTAIQSEVLLRTVENDLFSVGENGLPTFQMVINKNDFLNATSNTNTSIAAGDQFSTRLELVLTDGLTISFDQSTDLGPAIATFLFLTEVQ